MNKKIIRLLIIALLMVLGVGLFIIFFRAEELMAPSTDTSTTYNSNNEDTISEVMWDLPENFYQQLVEQWADTRRGEYSVVIENPDTKTVLARYNADEQYFAASIYKLYVAYAGYLKVDAGEYNLSDTYLNEKTIEQCLDEMIRTSDSPCAEKMWVELGKEELTDQLRNDYGLQGTSMTAITTTAKDAGIILGRIAREDDLSDSSTQKMLASMKDQIYTDTLDIALPNATVYNKIGFNLLQEYHDTALVDFGDGKRLVISILTNGAGTENIRGLARAISEALSQTATE